MYTKKRRPLAKPQLIKYCSLVLSIVAFLIPWFVEFEGLSPAGHRVFSVFLLAIVLWVSEAIPLHATAALIIMLQILLISDKAMVTLPEGFAAPKFSVFYYALAEPVIMLFLGGFFLAECASKYRLDRNLARVLLKPFGTSPRFIMLGLMMITAVMSMFMSNTATTATMMAVVIPLIAGLQPDDKLKTGLALCIPVAANVGGIGTPVGTPPNAIALGALSKAGISITFVDWMVMAIPLVLLILLFAWFFLGKAFPSKEKTLVLKIDSQFDHSPQAWIFYVTFAVTILLWLTEPLHHIKSTIVGFLPVVVLLATGVFTNKDMQNLAWHVLWLVAGGLALGAGVGASGLDKWLVGLVSWGAIGPSVIAGVLCLVALLMSTVISNSASANLLIPIGMSLAASGTVPLSPLVAAVFIAIGCSLAMSLPISTPPNAIAYSTGVVKTRQMATTGLAVGIVGAFLFVVVAPRLWVLLGVLGG